jgi:hypothetical protein
MADSAFLGLFTTPEQYQQSQRQLQEAQAIQYANLDPRAKADYGFYSAGQQLAGAIGGALGGRDPMLQKITQRQQLIGMIDPSNPDTYPQAIEAALRGGDQEAAFLLRNEMMKVREQSAVAQARGFEREQALLERGIGMQNRGLQANALELSKGLVKEDGTVDETVYNNLLGYGKIGTDIIEQRLKASKGLESQQVENLAKGLFKEDGTRDPEIEKKLSTTLAGRAILKQFAPETRELKNREKLLERTPSGTWKLITPEGQPAQTVSSDNAIQSLITSKAIHPTILPYANQVSKNFVNLDFEDQNALLEKLTKLNSDAQRYESDKSARDQSRATSNVLRDLNVQMVQLKIEQARSEAEKAKDGKPVNFGDSTKLADRATGVDKLVGLYDTFKPEYAGYGTNAIGEIAVFAAGKQSDEKSVALYQWWQNYQNNVNKVRNDLFGAALTAPEKAEFDKAMVTKGMDSAQAQANLRRQAEEASKAYDKLEKVLRVGGFSKAQLDALKPIPPLSSFVIEGVNTNPNNLTGGRR